MTNKLLNQCKKMLAEGWAMHHHFLKKIRDERLTKDQFKTFISHWYQMSKSHREAFPGLIANIKDDNIRFNLVGILYEEYGDGKKDMIHGKVLERLLKAVGLSSDYPNAMAPLKAISVFDQSVKTVWLTGEHPYAYGLHFGLEFLATAQQTYFSHGMLKYEFLTDYDREYFDLHAVAEVRHVEESEEGFLTYSSNHGNHEAILKGITLAEALLGNLWEEMDTAVFKN